MKTNKRKIVMYSGGQLDANKVIHKELIQLVGNKKNISMTYIPFCYDNHKTYYSRFIKRYSAFGVNKFNILHADRPLSQNNLKAAFKSDIIYLAGGNTFYLLKHLKKNKLLPCLKGFGQSGGVLAGLSAGAIILTPTIKLAGYPSFECDDNDVKLKSLTSLNLVKCEFFPHYTHSRKLNNSLLRYSESSKYPVYACSDGSGLIIDGDNKTFIGEGFMYFNGEKIIL